MIPSETVQDRLQRAFTPTSRGIAGLTDQLLAACVGDDVVFERVGDRCVYRWTEGWSTQEAPMPLAPAAFRTILARIAAMCNERFPGSVSPYGGEGELIVGASEVLVRFTNTTQTQKLEVKGHPARSTIQPTFPEKLDVSVADAELGVE